MISQVYFWPGFPLECLQAERESTYGHSVWTVANYSGRPRDLMRREGNIHAPDTSRHDAGGTGLRSKHVCGLRCLPPSGRNRINRITNCDVVTPRGRRLQFVDLDWCWGQSVGNERPQSAGNMLWLYTARDSFLVEQLFVS